jgi:hypothetical protein
MNKNNTHFVLSFVVTYKTNTFMGVFDDISYCNHSTLPHPLLPAVSPSSSTPPSFPSTPSPSYLVLACSAHCPVWDSVSPISAAHIVFGPKFLCIYLASEFALLLSCTTRPHSGFQFLSLLLFPLECCLYYYYYHHHHHCYCIITFSCLFIHGLVFI